MNPRVGGEDHFICNLCSVSRKESQTLLWFKIILNLILQLFQSAAVENYNSSGRKEHVRQDVWLQVRESIQCRWWDSSWPEQGLPEVEGVAYRSPLPSDGQKWAKTGGIWDASPLEWVSTIKNSALHSSRLILYWIDQSSPGRVFPVPSLSETTENMLKMSLCINQRGVSGHRNQSRNWMAAAYARFNAKETARQPLKLICYFYCSACTLTMASDLLIWKIAEPVTSWLSADHLKCFLSLREFPRTLLFVLKTGVWTVEEYTSCLVFWENCTIGISI